jgi:hypothetical protein
MGATISFKRDVVNKTLRASAARSSGVALWLLALAKALKAQRYGYFH